MASHNVNCKQLRNRHKCKYCQKGYMMDWAHKNHEKVCVYQFRGEEE